MSDEFFTTDGELSGHSNWSLVAGLVACAFLFILGVVMLIRIGVTKVVHEDTPISTPAVATANGSADASTFILDALLLPAIESGSAPRRWADPRAAMTCAAASRVEVDGEPLWRGSRVPVLPFVLEWEAHRCYPMGPPGPRFDGRVRLTIFPEDWGYSAMVEPAGMIVTASDGRITHLHRGGASLAIR